MAKTKQETFTALDGTTRMVCCGERPGGCTCSVREHTPPDPYALRTGRVDSATRQALERLDPLGAYDLIGLEAGRRAGGAR